MEWVSTTLLSAKIHMKIEELITQVIADNQKTVEQVKSGKDKAINVLVGKVLSVMRNADPSEVMSMLRDTMGIAQAVKIKKTAVNAPATDAGMLKILATEHPGGTLYSFAREGITSEFTMTDVMNKAHNVPAKIQKYIASAIIHT